MMSYAADAQTKIGPDRLDRVQEVMMQRLYDKVSQYCIFVIRCMLVHKYDLYYAIYTTLYRVSSL